jgi:LCP family protein required for cell wall assembly
MTKGDRLVLSSVVVVNIVIYLVVIVLAWEALPQPNPVEELVVGYFPTVTPVAVAEITTNLHAGPRSDPLPTSTLTPTPTWPPSALACPPPAGWSAYRVRVGDTLFSLARTHLLTVHDVQVGNCLSEDLIRVDQILFLPLPTPTPTPTASPTPPPDASPTPTSPPTPTATPTDPLLPITAPTPAAPLTMDPDAVNIILLGTDIRTPGSAWRTDTMILVTVNTRMKTAGMISFPRDLWVYIPGYGYHRINTADFTGEYRKYPGGGPALVKRTFLHNFGVPVHYYLRGDFNALIKLINTLGGVEVAVDCPIEDIFPDPESPDGLYTLSLNAGMQHLDGKAALFYARSRLSTSDFDRSRRQQKVLRGLWDKALQLDILPRVPELWETLGSAVQTDLNLTNILALAYVGTQLEPQNIKGRFIGRAQVQSWVTPQGAQVLLPKPVEMQAALVEFFAPPVQEITALTAEGARVVVRNGTNRPGLAALAVDRLRWEGVLDVTAADADRQDYYQTHLTILADKPLTEALLVELFPILPANIRRIPGLENKDEADMVVTLGFDYDPCRR